MIQAIELNTIPPIYDYAANAWKELVKQQEEVINQHLIKHGFNNIIEDFIKENFQFISQKGDNFQHLYYHAGQPDQIRIISIKKEPTYTPVINADFNKNAYSITVEYEYY